MILYEYIDQLVHVDLLLTMKHLIIVLNDYEVIPVLYFDAKKKNRGLFKSVLVRQKKIRNIFQILIIHKATRDYLLDFHHYL